MIVKVSKLLGLAAFVTYAVRWNIIFLSQNSIAFRVGF